MARVKMTEKQTEAARELLGEARELEAQLVEARDAGIDVGDSLALLQARIARIEKSLAIFGPDE